MVNVAAAPEYVPCRGEHYVTIILNEIARAGLAYVTHMRDVCPTNGRKADRKYKRNWEEKYVGEIRRSSACDYPLCRIRPRNDAPQSLSQLCPFSNLLRWLGQSNLCVPRHRRIAPVWPLSFRTILPHL